MRACAFGRTTGKVVDAICTICGLSVPHVEIAYRSAAGDGVLLLANHHLARCGRVCVMGGEPPSDFPDVKEVHDRGCKRCPPVSTVQQLREAGL
jgi:hypothetical protein